MQNNSMSPALRKPGLLKRAAEFFLAITLAGMVIAVFTNVVLRYGFDTGIVFYEELSRLLFVWMVCIGAALVFAENEHLGFDMLTSRLHGPARTMPRALCRWLSRITIAVCLGLVIQGSWEQVIAGMQSFSTVMRFPLALVAAAALLMAVAMLVILLVDIFHEPRGTLDSGNAADGIAGVE
jgi:TRAP-type transport system small permease protein